MLLVCPELQVRFETSDKADPTQFRIEEFFDITVGLHGQCIVQCTERIYSIKPSLRPLQTPCVDWVGMRIVIQ